MVLIIVLVLVSFICMVVLAATLFLFRRKKKAPSGAPRGKSGWRGRSNTMEKEVVCLEMVDIAPNTVGMMANPMLSFDNDSEYAVAQFGEPMYDEVDDRPLADAGKADSSEHGEYPQGEYLEVWVATNSLCPVPAGEPRKEPRNRAGLGSARGDAAATAGETGPPAAIAVCHPAQGSIASELDGIDYDQLISLPSTGGAAELRPDGPKVLERLAERTRMQDPRRHTGSDGYMAPLQSCLEGEPDYAEPDLNDAAEHGVLAPTGQATVHSDLQPVDPATVYSELGPPAKQGGGNRAYDVGSQADIDA